VPGATPCCSLRVTRIIRYWTHSGRSSYSSDLSGWAKALWFLFVLFIPLIGILVYLIVGGGSIHERAARRADQQDEAFRSSVQQAAARGVRRISWASSLTCATGGVITAEEFEREKARLLA